MGDSSEDEQAEDFPASNQQAAGSGRPTRSEREDQLRKMMDDEGKTNSSMGLDPRMLMECIDDEPMDTNETDPKDRNREQPALDVQKNLEKVISATPATTGDGRRRGRRKVMKKKMLKDEEGYLVRTFLPRNKVAMYRIS